MDPMDLLKYDCLLRQWLCHISLQENHETLARLGQATSQTARQEPEQLHQFPDFNFQFHYVSR